MLCSIPLAWTWRYCQWYWQCLHIQTKGALNTSINYCHLLELTLLCLVALWELDKSISHFKGAWCIYYYFVSYRNTCMQTVKILIICRILRHLIWACTVCLCPFLQDTMHKWAKQCPRNSSMSHYILKKKRSARTKSSRMFCNQSAFFFFLFIYFYIYFFISTQ